MYWPRETCTYAGDASPFRDSETSVASSESASPSRVGSEWWVPEGLGGSCAQRGAGNAPATRAQAASLARSNPASAHLSRRGRWRYAGRTLLAAVRGATVRQFVGRSAPPLAVGGVCRPDAPGPAPDRHTPPAAGGVLAWLARAGARRNPIQRDEHAPSECHDHQSRGAPGPRGVCETECSRLARSGRAQSAGRGDRASRRIRVGVGTPAVRPAAERRAVVGRPAVWRAGRDRRGVGDESASGQSFPLSRAAQH